MELSFTLWENTSTAVATTDTTEIETNPTEIRTVLNTGFSTVLDYSTNTYLPPVTTPNVSRTDYAEFKFDDYSQRVFIAILLLTASIVGIIGNSLVILSVAASRKLRNVTNIFVVNLAVADLLTSLFLPWNAVALLLKDGWPLPGALCSAVAGMLFVSVGCSVNTLASIAFIRWIVITKSIQIFQKICHSKVRLCLWISLTWLVPFVGTIIPPLLGFGHIGYNAKYSTCSSSSGYSRSDEYDILAAMVIYPIQMVVIVVSYVKIFRHVRKHSLHKPSDTMNSDGSSCMSDDERGTKLNNIGHYDYKGSRNAGVTCRNGLSMGQIETSLDTSAKHPRIGGNEIYLAGPVKGDNEVSCPETGGNSNGRSSAEEGVGGNDGNKISSARQMSEIDQNDTSSAEREINDTYSNKTSSAGPELGEEETTSSTANKGEEEPSSSTANIKGICGNNLPSVAPEMGEREPSRPDTDRDDIYNALSREGGRELSSVIPTVGGSASCIDECGVQNGFPTTKSAIDKTSPSSHSNTQAQTKTNTVITMTSDTESERKIFTTPNSRSPSYKKRFSCVLKRPLASIRRFRQTHIHDIIDFTNREMEITKNMFYIVVAFIVCLTPYALCLFIDSSDPVIPYAAAMVFFNSSLNPIIYAIKHPNFKTIFGLIVRCRLRDVPAPSTWWRAMFIDGICCCSNDHETYL